MKIRALLRFPRAFFSSCTLQRLGDDGPVGKSSHALCDDFSASVFRFFALLDIRQQHNPPLSAEEALQPQTGDPVSPSLRGRRGPGPDTRLSRPSLPLAERSSCTRAHSHHSEASSFTGSDICRTNTRRKWSFTVATAAKRRWRCVFCSTGAARPLIAAHTLLHEHNKSEADGPTPACSYGNEQLPTVSDPGHAYSTVITVLSSSSLLLTTATTRTIITNISALLIAANWWLNYYFFFVITSAASKRLNE